MIASALMGGAYFYAKNTGKLPETRTQTSKGGIQDEVVVLGRRKALTTLSIDIALNQKLFEKNKVKVEEIQAAKFDRNLLNTMDVFIGLLGAPLSSAMSQPDIKWFGSLTNRPTFHFVGSKDKKIEKVAINEENSDNYYQTKNVLEFMGFDPSKIDFVKIKEKDKIRFLLQDRIDAGIIASDIADDSVLLDQLEKKGKKVLLNSVKREAYVYPVGLITLSETFERKKELLQRFVKSLDEAQDFIRNNKEVVVKLIVDDYKVGNERAEMLYDDYIKISDGVENISKPEVVEKLIKVVQEGTPSGRFNPDDFIGSF